MESSVTPAPTVAGPSRLWPRTRKAGSPNIFRGVNLQQLQRLFHSSGDQDAERRAELVWGRGDGAELAQALIGLRARRRSSGRALGPKWLRAFTHLRINEGAVSGPDEDNKEEPETEADAPQEGPGVDLQGAAERQGEAATVDGPADSEQLQATPVQSLWTRARALKHEGKRDPERYLHRILR